MVSKQVNKKDNIDGIDLTDVIDRGSDTGLSKLNSEDGISLWQEQSLKKYHFEHGFYWKKLNG